MKVLHLTLKKQWFDAIAKNIKKNEYREIKPYWKKRLEGNHFDEIHFKNGYQKNAPFMRVEFKGMSKTFIRHEIFGKIESVKVYDIKLGNVLEIRR